jgi:microsomal prostaglandin-E synthase 2
MMCIYTLTHILPFFYQLAGLVAISGGTVAAKTVFDPTEQAKAYRALNITSKSDITSLKLYQYEVCPFCCKVKSFLDFHAIPYEVIEVDPMMKGELKFSEKWKKVPIVIVNDSVQLNNSRDIIDSLHQSLPQEVGGLNSEWRNWTDDKFVHVLVSNIYRSIGESLESFAYISENGNFNTVQRWGAKYAGAAAMYGISKIVKKRHGITDERAALFECGEDLQKHLKSEKGPFLGGNAIDLGDLAVHGALKSIEGLKSFSLLMEKYPEVMAWYKKVDARVGPSRRTNPKKQK